MFRRNMEHNPFLTITGIVLNKKKFRESSIICDVLTPAFGRISVLGKGVRKDSSPSYGSLQTGAEVELELYHKRDSEWYILKSANLKSLYTSANYETTACLQAGLELFLQLVIDHHEAEEYYRILLSYQQYLAKVDKNGIAIFWRLLLRIMEMNGISLKWQKCLNCNTILSEFFGYYALRNGMLCPACSHTHREDMIIIDQETADLMLKIPSIGNHINDLNISSQAQNTITRILLTHLNHHYDHHFRFKSLK
ncbi:MAG: DNA repair protein RecO [Candidatus Cloacimonetes bacterium]|nr:DNA repair protein RecO [Candidatus Cloacimonadota bacterium]